MASPVVAAGMESRNRESSSITSWPSGINHEVFLNFRGTDTRKLFTDLLYKKLKNAGIEVFKDDEKLRAGEEINQGLKDAIKRSRISIAIFSKDYASSKSCLMELVQMWECRISTGQTIIPIFYDVSPYAVTHQAGDFATSFEKHEEDDDVDSNTIKTWKEVLQLVGGISGYDRDNINGGHVSDLLEKVLQRVMEELKKDDQDVTDKLVGIDLHVQEMMTKLGVVYSHGQATKVCGEDVRVLGICGMQGVGKTTLAKVVFNKMHKLFDGCSFLECLNSEEVKVSQEMLIADLQKENRAPLRSYGEGIKKIASLFTNMKVLIVLDDVHQVEQIKGLAGKLIWFGPGSRIIVTTDNRNVLNVFDDGALEKYEVEPMRDQDALQLFRKHAFEGNAPQDISEYDYLSLDIVKAIGGLPGAIVRQASYLCHHRKDIQIWRSTLGFLKKDHEDKVEAASKDLRRERGGVAEISQEVGTLQQDGGVSVEEYRRMCSENKKLTDTLNDVLLGYNALKSQMINLAKEISTNEVMESRKRKFEDYIDLELWKKPTESVKPKTSVAYFQVDASDTSLVVKDGYQWRKYGQKKVTRDNPSPAAYFKCSFAPSCPVKKKVQRSFKDPSLLIATYQGDHNHRCPSQGAKPASAPPPISPSSVKPSNHDASLDLVQRGFSNPEEKPKQETEVGTPLQLQLQLQEMVSSLVGDPNFTASLAEAISGAMFDRSRTDS